MKYFIAYLSVIAITLLGKLYVYFFFNTIYSDLSTFTGIIYILIYFYGGIIFEKLYAIAKKSNNKD